MRALLVQFYQGNSHHPFIPWVGLDLIGSTETTLPTSVGIRGISSCCTVPYSEQIWLLCRFWGDSFEPRCHNSSVFLPAAELSARL